MIKQVQPGELVEAPMNATFRLRFRSPWTAEELADADEIAVVMNSPDHTVTTIEAEADGADVVLRVTPSTFPKAGLWELNPMVRWADDVHRFPLALALNLLENTVTRRRFPSAYAIQ